jgi:hypothetical protein
VDFFNWECSISLDNDGEDEDKGHDDEEKDDHDDTFFDIAAAQGGSVN